MQIGAVYPQIELRGDPDAVRRIGVGVEALGYDHLLVFDHVLGATHDREPKLWGPYTERDPFHDPFVMLAYLAARTTRLGLVTGVLILPQRQTVLVARQAADLDLLSSERLRLGVGTGWNYVEYEALGQDFTTRGRRLDEQIPYLRRLWAEPLVSFDGRFDRLDRGHVNPHPTRSIPIWVGGFSEPAFRRGARLGDGFVFAGDVDQCIEALGRVRELLAEAGRSPEGFGAELVAVRAKSVDDVARAFERWERAGGTHASVASMRLGLDSVEGHLDYFAAAHQRLA